MARIIFSIINLVAFAVLVVLNAGNVVAFNLFGWQLEAAPLIAIVIVSFTAGVLYSFLFYVMSYFAKGRRAKLVRTRDQLKQKEHELAGRDDAKAGDKPKRRWLRKSVPDKTDTAQSGLTES
ncbi:MAG: LapA family protein [Spirochaetaceae bacterium]|nr:MAG: LapA family protein [Spirochaetaceae bacterium]